MTILKNSNRYRALAWLTMVVIILFGLSLVIISGCTDTLQGDVDSNRAPIAYFVNIPPDGTLFSHNPEIYWFGSDIDGQIVYYRYLVATKAELGSAAATIDAARQWAAGQDDQDWQYIDVNPTLADPQTSRIIPLSADPENPIIDSVEQFIFLQAFDDDNLGSVIAVKDVSRNDHPPQTRIYNSWKDDSPYVNALTEGGIITGVGLNWFGTDRRDYDEQGLVAPPFEYEWKLFGPFDSTEISKIRDIDSGGFYDICWWNNEGQQFFDGDTLRIIDSFLVGEDEERHWERWDTLIWFGDSVQSYTDLGIQRDTVIHLDMPGIANKLVAESDDGYDSWVLDTADVFYDLYRNAGATDVTIRRHFLFTVRARDDAQVPDPTPAFCSFPVIEPRHERDVLVLDFTSGGTIKYVVIDPGDGLGPRPAKELFKNLVESWNPEITFDTNKYTGDYFWATLADTELRRAMSLEKILQYKTMIWYSDHTSYQSSLKPDDPYPGGDANLIKAIDAGVNVWATGRCLFRAAPFPSDFDTRGEASYDYFGVESIFYSAWLSFFMISGTNPVPTRIEDFVGAYSVDESKWPNIDIDPDLLRERYTWPTDVEKYPWLGSVYLSPLPFKPDSAALPQVDWCGRRYGTEVMYIYKSLYGRAHFLGYPFAIEGAPCGHRFETNLFRTVYTMFPPWPIKDDQMRELAYGILDWLHDPWLNSETVNEKRYPDAKVFISIDEAQQKYVDP